MEQRIDLKNWKRRDHFKAFSAMERPQFSICLKLNVSSLLKTPGKFFPKFLFLVHSSCQQIPEFRYRILQDGSVVYYESDLDISFNILAEDGLFSNCRLSRTADFGDFSEQVESAIRVKSRVGEIRIDPHQKQNLIVTSYLPWVEFTALSEPVINRNDSIPRITWGKYSEDGHLPLSIQAHHGFVDGVHIGRFQTALYNEMERFKSRSS